VERILLRGDTKCSVVVDGMQVDCRAVAPEQFGAAWQYFTGSQAHNIRLRGMALRLGLTLNEYGVFRVDGGARVAGETEDDVYAALGLRWIPPEQREDRGEVEAAQLATAEV
jgi:DNA polymerase (family 10)